MTITPITEMLKSRVPGNESRDVYGSGAIRDAFLACIAGTTLGALPNIDTVHKFLLGKHLSASGRGGWKWQTLVDGVLHDGPLSPSLKHTTKIQFVNATPIDTMVTSKFHRGANVTLNEILAVRAAKTPATESAKPAPMLTLPAASNAVIDAETATAPIVESKPETTNPPNRKTRRAAKNAGK